VSKLLLVEDSGFFRSIVQRSVRAHGPVDIVSVSTKAEAIEAIRHEEDAFFLALLDLNLPDAQGTEIVDAVTGLGITAIVFTGQYDRTLRAELVNRDVLDYVLKDSPASLSYVTGMVNRVLRNRSTTALVVDDSVTTRSHITRLLERYQFTVRQAETAAQALELVRDDAAIRLLITDHEMPGMSGFELITKLRRDYDKERLAIIGISGSGDDDLSARFIKYGANDFLNKPFLPEEFLCRVTHNMEMQEMAQELREAAIKDPLTGLYNRRFFFDTGEKLLASMQRLGRNPVVAMVDIDHFKSVNDNHGHDLGDKVLIAVAQTIQGSFRRANDIVARLGGEEFGILLNAANGDDETAEIRHLDEVRKRVAAIRMQTDGGCMITPTVSIGAVKDFKADTIDGLLKRADINLYAAKDGGRNRVVTT
jgi:diguanylate cyclase (GGDEF)-like protein